MNRVPEILAGLVPEFSDLPHEAKPVAKVALRRAVLRQSIWFGGGFWLAVFAVACMAGLAALVGGIESGAILLEEGDERLIGLLYTFGGGVLVILLVLGGYSLHRRCSERRAVGPRVQLRLQPPLHAGEQRRPFSRNSELPAPENPVRLHEEQPVAAPCGHRHALATTAAGSGGTTTTLIDASHADAMAWLDWLKPGGNQ